MSLEDIADALRRYDYAGKLKALTTQLRTKILLQILDTSQALTVTTEEISDSKSSLSIVAADTSSYTIGAVFENLSNFIIFINTMLPEAIAHSLAIELSSVITSTLIDVNLQECVPLDLSSLAEFEATLVQIRQFDAFMKSQHWTRELELEEWVRRVPSVWYKKKCDSVLVQTRTIVSQAATSDRKIVERTGVEMSFDAVQEASEKRESSGGRRSIEVMAATVDHPAQTSDDAYDWNEEWDNDAPASPVKPADVDNTGDDDWGDFDVDFDDEQQEIDLPAAVTTVEEPDDWNWGEDEDGDPNPSAAPSPVQKKNLTPLQPRKKLKPLIPKSSPSKFSSRNSSLTEYSLDPESQPSLNETFVVTSVPQQILGLISSLTRDSADLSTRHRTSSIAPAAKQLQALISYVLATYRALAPLHYGDSFDSKFYLSNDCLHLAEQVGGRMRDLGADAFLLKEMSNRLSADEMA